MLRVRVLLSVVSLALVFSALPACARECAPAVKHGWLRLPPVEMPMLAAYAEIENPCSTSITIVGARSPAFAEVSLHETRIVDGISRMRPVTELTLAAGDSAVLAPGGMHLMLMQPRGVLAPGSKVVIEFVLADGGTLRGEFEVRTPAR